MYNRKAREGLLQNRQNECKEPKEHFLLMKKLQQQLCDTSGLERVGGRPGCSVSELPGEWTAFDLQVTVSSTESNTGLGLIDVTSLLVCPMVFALVVNKKKGKIACDCKLTLAG